MKRTNEQIVASLELNTIWQAKYIIEGLSTCKHSLISKDERLELVTKLDLIIADWDIRKVHCTLCTDAGIECECSCGWDGNSCACCDECGCEVCKW
jgi:hypothetical protein